MAVVKFQEETSDFSITHDARPSAKTYQNREPFPHAIIEDFLDPSIVSKLLETFPSQKLAIDEFNRGTIEKKKFAYNPHKLNSSFITSLFEFLNSNEFVSWVEDLTGIQGLYPDPDFLGGGFHETVHGGRLGIHADFNIHPKLKLERRVNILIYLNPNWKEEYKGELELWARDMSQMAVKVSPELNRCVVFDTNSDSYHGHPEPLATPEGKSRRSLALYYYSEPRDGKKLDYRTTRYRNRPGTNDTIPLKMRMYYSLERYIPERAKKVLFSILKALRNRGAPKT